MDLTGLLTVEEAGGIMRVKPRWIRSHRADLPFLRPVGPWQLRVSEAGMRAWLSKGSRATAR
jgi:hypothetical protein